MSLSHATKIVPCKSALRVRSIDPIPNKNTESDENVMLKYTLNVSYLKNTCRLNNGSSF